VTARPAVSVIIPAYQSARFLAEAIDSALAQDEPVHEVVVVDDGSTDDTPAVLDRYGPPVVAVRHPVNRGVAAARNTALATLTGEVVVCLDADDRMRPHRVRVTLDHLLAGGDDIGCVIGQQQVFGETDLPAWAREADGSPARWSTSPVTAWRRTYDRVGDYDESFPIGEDSDWLLRVRDDGLEVLLIDEVVNERRVHDTNTSSLHHGQSPAEYLKSVRGLLQRRRGEA
jgi:glycosyltransferase involved in cell wall biosynthesis